MYKSSKEKGSIILNLCYYLISKYKLLSGAKEREILLRLIIFTILKSGVLNLKAQIRYTSLFRNKSVISSDEDFYLSLFSEAIEFIERITHSQLNISKIDYNSYIDDYEKKELLKNTNKSTKSKYKI